MKGLQRDLKGVKNVDFDRVLGEFKSHLEDLRRCL